MNKLLKYFFVFMLTFSLVLTSAFAAKKKEADTKESEEVVETTGESEKPTFYYFRRTGCSHCADLLSYLGANYKKYSSKVNIVVYDYYEGKNNVLVEDVLEALNIDPNELGFPFYVIGSSYDMGFAEAYADSFDSFVNSAIAANQKDVVGELLKKNKYSDLVKTDVYEAMDKEGIEYDKD